MSLIGRLGVNLAVNSTEFVKGIGDASKTLKEFESENKKRLAATEKSVAEFMNVATVAAAGVAMFGAALVKTVQEADKISDMAKGCDMSVESLLAAQQALQKSGGEAENYSTMLQKLSNAQDGAKEGTDAMRESFARLGIKASEVEGLKPDELFNRVATALAGVEDTSKRAAIAQDLLGKSVKGVSWSDYVNNYLKFKDPALVESIEKNAQAWGDIEKSMHDISMLMQKIAQPFAKMTSDSVKIADNVSLMFKSFELNMPNFVKYGEILLKAFYPFLMLPKILEKIKEYTGNESAGLGGSANQAFPTNMDIGTGDTYGKASAADKAKDVAAQKQRSATIKAHAEDLKRLDILRESLIFQKSDLELAQQKYTVSADTYAVSEQTLRQSQEAAKLRAEEQREIATAQAEYKSAIASEKNKDLLDTKLRDIATYYKVAIEGQEQVHKLARDNLGEEIKIRNKYIDQDLSNQTNKELKAIDMRKNAAIDLLNLDSQAYKLSQNDYNLQRLKITAAQELADVQQKYADKRKEIQTEFERTTGQARDKELKAEKLKALADTEAAEIAAMQNIDGKRQQNLEADIARQKSWGAGWDEAMKNYAEISEKASNRGAAAFEMVASEMEGAIRKFVDTGKFAFKDLVGSIVKDLLYMEMRAQATTIMSMLWGGIKASFGGSGGFSPAANRPIFGGDVFSSGKASGGAINSPTIVGENGMELFVPNTPGTVIPNGSWQQLAAGGGGSGLTVNGNYIANMSAIDTQSATQFLAKNKSTIWAAYQSANRSVPISR